jgi:RND family efflux transporter MFP subunit
MRPPSSRKVQGAFILALAGSLALAGCDQQPPQQSAPAAGRPTAAMTITVTKVQEAPVVRAVEATGSVQPWQEIIIGPEVGGYRVSAVLVDVGSVVHRGQTLVKLDAEMLDAEVNSKRAALRSAEARAANADAALRRGQAVLSSGALSAANVDQLVSDQVAGRAAVETAKADLATSDLRLKYTDVTSPDDGVVTSRLVSVGQVAQAGGEMLRLLRQSRVEWRAEVPESQLGQVKPGEDVTLIGSDGSTIEGKVRTVAPTISVTSRTALVYVDIKSGNARPGMFARGHIDIGKGNALLVPVQSVVVQDGYSYVFVLGANDVVSRRLVQPGGLHDGNVEITEGLKADETVAVKGAGFLKDRDTVKVSQ